MKTDNLLTKSATEDNIIDARNVIKHYRLPRSGNILKPGALIKAVDGINFNVRAGETFGLVGESGCGKTTISRMILNLEHPTSGRLTVAEHDVNSMSRVAQKEFRRDVQAVFQDPYGSLNPRHKVLEIVGEPMRIHHKLSGVELQNKVQELLDMVGLPRDAVSQYPHEFSGGMRQRLAIARAISVRPKLIVLDEPVSALDVSIRAQVLNILRDIQQELGLTYLFIAHDLAVVEYMSDRIGVMYLGRMVETASAEQLFCRPRHPYTHALIQAASLTDKAGQGVGQSAISGEIPSPLNPPAGCRFHTRCPFAKERCAVEAPELEILDDGHAVACHFHENFDFSLHHTNT